MTCVSLCGGYGTRLWPISRELMPKQFAPLFAGASLFQKTVERNAPIATDMLHICNAEHYFLAKDQLDAIANQNAKSAANNRFLIEPIGRSTAPAIALAALSLMPDEIMLVVPSDHLIDDQKAYEAAVRQAADYAREGFLATFGIRPTYPETGYGYIEAGANGVVAAFREKPARNEAQRLIAAGGVYWNSGMFCFAAGAFLAALEKYAPNIYAQSKAAFAAAKTEGDAIRIPREAMAAIESISVDYAVMERADNVRLVPLAADWSDMGSFESLYAKLPKDASENATGGAIAIDSARNLAIESDRQIALIGVSDLLIADTPDALLIARQGEGQRVREVVERLKASGGDLHHSHRAEHRPWGSFEIIAAGDRYKIKRLVVKAGKRLSLQKHYHRNEHWIVVSGTASVTIGDQTRLVRTNESTYIHAGLLHRLENPGKVDLVMIEAQVGDYLGEDDIVRVEDDFRRE